MAKLLSSILLIIEIVTYMSCQRPEYSYDPRSYVMPESCEGLHFCHDKGQFYPTNVINDVLQGLKIQDRIGEETYGYETSDHISDSPLDPECATKEMKSKPVYYVLDKNNQTRVVVQSNEYKFLQEYDLRWCKKVGRVNETLHFRPLMLRTVNMTCNDVITTLDFQVLTPDKFSMELISVEMPVFCKARYDLLIKSSS